MAGYGVKGYFIVQDIVQLNAVYGKDNGLMANCHVRIAYAPNTIETARVLSAMTGKTTVVEERTSLSGTRSSLKNASVSVSETARSLLTEDECMRLGDRLDLGPDGMRINGRLQPSSLTGERDCRNRCLSPSSLESGVIPAGKALLLSDNHPGGFDSRYFGLVPLAALHRARPIMIFNTQGE